MFSVVLFVVGNIVLFGNWPDPTALAFFLVELIPFAGMVYSILLIQDRQRGKFTPKQWKERTKPIWAVGVSGKKPKPPYLTYGLMVVMAVIFLLELVFSENPFPISLISPGLRTLIAFGAASGSTVTGGEWYRLFTAIFLHGNIAHIFFNFLALLIAGKILEHLIGPVWFFVVFALSGVGGFVLSMMVNLPEMVALGASGGIMGLMGTGLAISFRLKEDKVRKRLQGFLFRVLIYSVIPTTSSVMGAKVDYVGHLGGALAGLFLGFCLFFYLGKNGLRRG